MKIPTKIGRDLIFYLEISKQRVINSIPNKEHNLSHIEPVVWNPREKVYQTLELENNMHSQSIGCKIRGDRKNINK